MPTEAEWKMLARLFADEHAPFRHQMGLLRVDANEFYAPTERAETIRAQKQRILTAEGAEKYLLETEEGHPAFREFARTVGCEAGPMPDRNASNRAATLALEPDWMLLTPADWTLVWASVCFPTRWSLAGKRGRPLAEVHGVVPGLNAELGRKIDVFFGRLLPGEGWGRANWGLASNGELNQHPDLPYTPISSATERETVWVRVESQHLMKLPGSGAVAFGIRIVNFPLGEVRAHPAVAAGLRERLRTMPEDVAAYKGIPAEFWRRV